MAQYPIDQSAPRQIWKVTAGDDLVFTMRLKLDGTLEPLTGWSIGCDVCNGDNVDEVFQTLDIGSGIDVDLGGPVGEAVVKISGDMATSKLRTLKSLVFDLQYTNPAGHKQTYLYVTLVADKDATRR